MGMLLRRYYKQVKLAKEPEVALKEKSLKELKAEAKDKGIEGYSRMSKEELEEALKG